DSRTVLSGASRRMMSYACVAHEPVIVVQSNGDVTVLAPTAPLIGVFDDQHHLFKQDFIELSSEAHVPGQSRRTSVPRRLLIGD
ncbi:MAG TPA: hypothetical protein VN224_04300, partial [Xanthomonadales bacterium]|nr:hypothetical protein [Xanthomonadales bacterium]